jgi:hypothetical protein
MLEAVGVMRALPASRAERRARRREAVPDAPGRRACRLPLQWLGPVSRWPPADQRRYAGKCASVGQALTHHVQVTTCAAAAATQFQTAHS